MANTLEMPKLGFDMAEGTLVRWVIGENLPVERGQVIAEIETDKATVEVESMYSGTVLRHLVPQGEIVPVGTPIAVIGEPGEAITVPGDAAPAPEKTATPQAPAPSPAGGAPTPVSGAASQGEEFPGGVKASPLARRMASENGLDLQAIQGTGPGGRVIKRDIEAFLSAPVPVKSAVVPAALPPAPAPVVTTAPEDRRIPMSKMRTTIARRLVESVQQVPHIFITREFDMDGLMTLRKQVNDALAVSGEKISVNDFVVKAVALALREFPRINSVYAGDTIVERGAVNVGVAVSLEDGLLTVVCKNADQKSVRQIAADLRSMVARAREGKLKPADIEGSTFSVSNLGMFDVEQFTAIINPPESAILAVGAVRETPVVKDGAVVPGMRMKATISVDHRTIDGADAARFMQTLAAYLESPLRLLL